MTADYVALLVAAERALSDCAKAALTVKPTLDTPYSDRPEWTPWTRWMERPARDAHDTAIRLRRYLRALSPNDGSRA